jgi:hypothetical protein
MPGHAPGMIVFSNSKARMAAEAIAGKYSHTAPPQAGLRPSDVRHWKENALARWSAGRARLGRNEAFALSLLAGELAGAADGLGLLAGTLL